MVTASRRSYSYDMRTTIDHAGRVRIPKTLREQAGLTAGAKVDVRFRDGRIEIEPETVAMRLVKDGGLATDGAKGEMPALRTADVRAVLEHSRR